MTAVGNWLYFNANGGLWKSNGSSAGTVRVSGSCGELTAVGSSLYTNCGAGLTKFDSTSAVATLAVMAINVALFSNMTAAGGTLYFSCGMALCRLIPGSVNPKPGTATHTVFSAYAGKVTVAPANKKASIAKTVKRVSTAESVNLVIKLTPKGKKALRKRLIAAKKKGKTSVSKKVRVKITFPARRGKPVAQVRTYTITLGKK